MFKPIFISIFTLILLSACSTGTTTGNSNIPANPGVEATTIAVPSTNSKYLTVNVTKPGNSSVCGYVNAPCVTITICPPNSTAGCTNIDNILLDSGSVGLRVFSSILPPELSNTLMNNNIGGQTSIAQCTTFGDSSQNWGPVVYAGLNLGGLYISEIPILLVDSSYSFLPATCDNAATSPEDFGLNGILGVAPLSDDYGTPYFVCNSSSCTPTNSSPDYITNPIIMLPPPYNNGITIKFPSIPQSGAYNVIGYALFGEATESENTPPDNASLLQVYSGQYPINVITSFMGQYNSSFLDTGSNLLFFSNSELQPLCQGNYPDFFCPDLSQLIVSYQATIIGTESQYPLDFAIANAQWLMNGSNTAFSTIAAYVSSFNNNTIDWGMPFFYGKTVSVIPPGSTFIYGGITYQSGGSGYWIYY